MNNDEEMDIHISDDSVDDRLYRGVKLFISRAGGPGGTTDFFDRHLESGDTTLLKKIYAANLQKQQLDVKTKWVRDVPEKKFPPPPFYYESHFFEQPFGVRIEDYNRFVTMKIIPQIGFALLLLLVTSGAFLFAFRSLRSQQQLAAMKDDFISNMSHELKTPLATMQVALEAMQQMEPATQNETLKDYLGMTAQELVRIGVLVHKVMSTMLPDHGTFIHFETINIRQLIEQTIQSLALVLDQRNATVNFSSKTSDLFINGEAIHLQGIFHNLIDNSLKYGKELPEISIALSQSANVVKVTFDDNGPGIPEAYLNKVFDKFFRVPSGNLHNVKGYGLGLHYVSQVMLQHNGHVTVKNLVAGGCRFTLTFPSLT
ncbi:MAG: HAMP domain-containing sensor histidine kinase, partial [Chitinophagales bacterium]